MRRLAVAVLLLAAACGGEEKKNKEQPAPAAKAEGSLKRKQPKRKLTQVKPPFDIVTPPADAKIFPDGLVLKHVHEGTGATPGPNDGVKIKYAAWRMDGTTFATTEPSPTPTTMWLYSVAPGFTEALTQMRVGGKSMFWVPPEIGYPGGRAHGTPERIAYMVELVEVLPAPPTPPDVAKPPADAKKEKSGVTWTLAKKAPAGADHPRAWDKVTVGYTGWDATGRILDSSEIHGKPVTMSLEKLPPMFVDVVPALAAGDRARVWFPGEMLGKSKHTPSGKVCFEVELISVIALAEPPPAPRDVGKPPADALKTPRGVLYKVLKAGGGTQKPAPTDLITVDYTGWTADGKRFDSTIPEGKPKQFRITGVIPGWADALPLMPVGDSWRLWIPEELAYKGAMGRPQGMLVFDVTLIATEPVRTR